jgi:type III secretion system YscJ/HrcJ family lipoprotein
MARGRLFGFALLVSACGVPISAGLDEGNATLAVVALEKSGIAAEKERDPERENAYRVVVARDDAASALGVLSQEGLPPPDAPGVLDALGKGSLVPSRLSEQAKLVVGTSGELERTLRAVDGVVSVRVHLAVPPRDPLALGEQAPGTSASVLLRHRGSAPPLALLEVQRLVAGAVPGLEPAAVSVVMTPAPARARLAERELSRFGPLTVTRSSMTTLRVVLGVAAVVNALLLGCLVALWSRMRRLESELSDRARETGAEKR